MSSTIRKERDLRIDFFRGLALIFIFVDHVPNNSWASVTLKNFGFADSSEVFVLLAGYSAGLAYWSVAEREGFRGTLNKASRRASEIYIWHLAVFLGSALMLYSAARVFSNADYVNHIGMAELAQNPLQTALGVLALFYQPNMMNILPMYVVLMLSFPLILWGLRKSVVLTLAISFAIWFVANATGFNFPTHQRAEGWFFNPVAWQLLFTTGAAVSVLARRTELSPRQDMLIAAAAIVVFAFVVAAPWLQIPGLGDQRLLSRELVEPMSKHDLAAWRFVHVLALAYLVAVLIPKNAGWLRNSWATSVATCGKHSLEIFSLGTLLSFFGWIALPQMGSNQVTMLMVNVVGIAIMGMTAWQMSRRREAARVQQRVGSVQALAS